MVSLVSCEIVQVVAGREVGRRLVVGSIKWEPS